MADRRRDMWCDIGRDMPPVFTHTRLQGYKVTRLQFPALKL